MTPKRMICGVCKTKQWGLIILVYNKNELGVCNDCYEIYDTIEIKLDMPRRKQSNA